MRQEVVTGLGGDEMVALSQAEHPHKTLGELADAPAWIGPTARVAGEYADDGAAPPAVVNSMTLLSLATTAPVLLRAGIWPVHPFTHPTMIRLGEQLPVDWRGFKQLQRRQLASLGLGTEVTQPQHRESFAEVVQHALTTCAQPLFAAMLRTPTSCAALCNGSATVTTRQHREPSCRGIRPRRQG